MKLAFPSRESVPEPFRDKASEQDGKFVVDIGEASPIGFRSDDEYAKALGKTEEFRGTNRGLKAKNDELEAKLKGFEGIDPEEHRTLKTRVSELEQKGVKGAGDLQALVQKAVESAVGPMAKRQEETERLLKERDEQLARDKETIARNAFEGEVTKAAIRVGAQETAVADIVRRGSEVFRRGEDGKFVAMDGTTPMLDSNGKALTVDGWLGRLTKSAPHLFKASGGGGATGSPATEPIGGNGTYPSKWYNTREGQEYFAEHAKDIATGKLKPSEA